MEQPLAIECRGISKTYSHFSLHGVDLGFEQGTVMGLVGPNGAGKSTVMRLVMGLLQPDSGTIRVLGHSMPDQQIAAKRDIGFVAEDMRLYEGETIAYHMQFVRSIYDSWDEEHARTLLRRFDLQSGQKVKGLSHGQRVKATLLLALARRPRLLVFDEPTTGLDPSVRREVLNEMMDALADETRSILFSSHNTQDVEQIADAITFLYGGRVVESLDKETFLDSWRRLRLICPREARLPELPNTRDVSRNGSIAVVTVDHYDESVPARFAQAGFAVDAVQRLNLEEIFLSIVTSAKSQTPHGVNT